MNNDFYIGYFSQSPPELARFTRRLVIGVAVVVLCITAMVALRQTPVDSGVFEYGEARQFEGVLYEFPIPTLRVAHSTDVANYILVGTGKHGLPPFARNHDGQKVRFKGTLIYRQNLTMIELNDAASFQALGESAPNEKRGHAEVIGEVSLTGELVDTKCFFGVMRPAVGKVHRACAVRCLSGGVPPGLLVRDEQNNGSVVMLAGADGKPLQYDVEWAARRIQCTGKLEQNDGVPVLRVASMQLE
jgi:hypothetical protein